jgi:hypothetical protein
MDSDLTMGDLQNFEKLGKKWVIFFSKADELKRAR